jgi:hypothetical protein
VLVPRLSAVLRTPFDDSADEGTGGEYKKREEQSGSPSTGTGSPDQGSGDAVNGDASITVRVMGSARARNVKGSAKSDEHSGSSGVVALTGACDC